MIGPRNLVLIGFMGSGKSTLARILSARLGLKQLDTDALIEAGTGRRIAQLFSSGAEHEFRDLETQLLRNLQQQRSNAGVIACGGGIILRDENRMLLRQLGLLVYVDVPMAVAWERVSRDRSRPLAQDYESFARRYHQRLPIYRSLADVTVQSGQRPASALGWELLEKASRFGLKPLPSCYGQHSR